MTSDRDFRIEKIGCEYCSIEDEKNPAVEGATYSPENGRAVFTFSGSQVNHKDSHEGTLSLTVYDPVTKKSRYFRESYRTLYTRMQGIFVNSNGSETNTLVKGESYKLRFTPAREMTITKVENITFGGKKLFSVDDILGATQAPSAGSGSSVLDIDLGAFSFDAVVKDTILFTVTESLFDDTYIVAVPFETSLGDVATENDIIVCTKVGNDYVPLGKTDTLYLSCCTDKDAYFDGQGKYIADYTGDRAQIHAVDLYVKKSGDTIVGDYVVEVAPGSTVYADMEGDSTKENGYDKYTFCGTQAAGSGKILVSYYPLGKNAGSEPAFIREIPFYNRHRVVLLMGANFSLLKLGYSSMKNHWQMPESFWFYLAEWTGGDPASLDYALETEPSAQLNDGTNRVKNYDSGMVTYSKPLDVQGESFGFTLRAKHSKKADANAKGAYFYYNGPYYSSWVLVSSSWDNLIPWPEDGEYYWPYSNKPFKTDGNVWFDDRSSHLYGDYYATSQSGQCDKLEYNEDGLLICYQGNEYRGVYPSRYFQAYSDMYMRTNKARHHTDWGDFSLRVTDIELNDRVFDLRYVIYLFREDSAKGVATLGSHKNVVYWWCYADHTPYCEIPDLKK